jgi:hypothetical protein
MARTRGCTRPAVLAGTIICWAAVEGAVVAQEAAEVTEELGHSYRLARRITAQGSIIETLLFAGQAIVTDIAVPAPGAGKAAGTGGAIAGTRAVNANASQSDAAALPPGLGSGFAGTWLTGEIIDDYLVLHRIRANDPVAHDIFREGKKVGSVTEIGPPIRVGRLAGRISFTFEPADDRFVVHLRQPDGTTIHATTEHGRFPNQTVEHSASLAAPPRTGAGSTIASGRQPEAIRPSVSPSPEPQRPAQPQEAAGAVTAKEPAPAAPTQPEMAPLPGPIPLPRMRPAISTGAAPFAGLKPRTASVATERPAATPAKPNVRARETATPVAKPKTAQAAENAQRPPRSGEKPVSPVVPRPLPPPWDKSPPPWDTSVRHWQYGR